MLRPHLNFFPVTTTIEFDDVPSGTAIDTHYQSQGATFASITTSPPSQSSAFATFSALARTPTNTVSIDPTSSTFYGELGGIKVTFDRLVFGVSIYARATVTPERMLVDPQDNRAFIVALDENDNFLGETTYPHPWWDPNFGDWQNLAVTSAGALQHIFVAKIKSVVFSSQHVGAPNVWAAFDTLRFWRFEAV